MMNILLQNNLYICCKNYLLKRYIHKNIYHKLFVIHYQNKLYNHCYFLCKFCKIVRQKKDMFHFGIHHILIYYFVYLHLNDKSIYSIQSLISAVWQDCHIFYGTVYENILFGRPGASRDEVVAAAQKANLHSFIETLPKGYDTPLGENGMRFSGGERQRIALARAFLKNSPILIFDEATSSLDRKNELEIQKSFFELSREKTSLVIAHRLSTIQQADQIIVLERGKIVAAGTHEQLRDSSPEYMLLTGGQHIGGEYE